jgi:hypothetical protein
MRYYLIPCLVVAAALSAGSTWAADTEEVPMTFQQPALITPVGQAADGLMLNVVCRQAGIKVIYDNLFNADSLDALVAGKIEVPVSMRGAGPVKTLILVPGGSTKGLGAAKIDEKFEMDRVKGLIERARKLGMGIIMCHLGGEARRGSLSDPFNRQAAEACDVMIVVKDGNADGFFTKIAEARDIPIYELDQITGIGEVLKVLFGGE